MLHFNFFTIGCRKHILVYVKGFNHKKMKKNALCISTFYDDYFGDRLNAIRVVYWPHIMQRKGLANLATLPFSH
jgi:hypothetical protein